MIPVLIKNAKLAHQYICNFHIKSSRNFAYIIFLFVGRNKSVKFCPIIESDT